MKSNHLAPLGRLDQMTRERIRESLKKTKVTQLDLSRTLLKALRSGGEDEMLEFLIKECRDV